MAYDIGDDAVLTARFRKSGVFLDPGSVVFKVKSPSGTSTYTYGVDSQVAKVDQGVFTCTVPLTVAGLWEWRVTGTAPAKGAEEGEFIVQPQKVS